MMKSFRIWLEAKTSASLMPILHIWDKVGTAGEPGGDYDDADVGDYLKHLGIGKEQFLKNYKYHDGRGGQGSYKDWSLKKDLPAIEGIHYGYECAVDAEGDRLLMGAPAYYFEERDQNYYHDAHNYANVWVLLTPELLEKIEPHIVHKGGYGNVGIVRDIKKYQDYLKSARVRNMTWTGVSNLIKMIAKRQEMTPPASLYSQDWPYSTEESPKTPLIPEPRKPTAVDPRQLISRKPGEDAKDWLSRAIARQKADYDWKHRTGD